MIDLAYHKKVLRIRLESLYKTSNRSQIAKNLGITPATLSKMLSVNTSYFLDVKSLLEICNQFDCSMDWLLGTDKDIKSAYKQFFGEE